jgi:hypothetical protein
MKLAPRENFEMVGCRDLYAIATIRKYLKEPGCVRKGFRLLNTIRLLYLPDCESFNIKQHILHERGYRGKQAFSSSEGNAEMTRTQRQGENRLVKEGLGAILDRFWEDMLHSYQDQNHR